MNMLPEDENQRRMELYHQGLTDREIARRVYVCVPAVRAWRKSRGLPGRSGRPQLPEEEQKRRMALLRSGKTMAEAAAELGVTERTLKSWVDYWEGKRND